MILLIPEDLTWNERQRIITENLEKRLKILQWISAADFSSRHKAVSMERVENSGTWFLQSDPFKNWLNGTGSNLLCYEGIRKLIVYFC